MSESINNGKRMDYPRDKKGKFLRGHPGRPKGSKDKVPQTVKENLEALFEELGGVKGVAEWARKNNHNMEKAFDWYFSMAPKNVTGTVNANVKVFDFNFGENGEPYSLRLPQPLRVSASYP